MEVRTGSIDFSAPLRGSGPRIASQTVVLPRQVANAVVGLSGYTVAYSGDDHHVGRVEIRLDATVNANTITVEGRFGLRDWSGDWDDDYDGTIEFVVLADLESATAPPPREDLIVTGMELNQAVQFFRAASYLDPATAQPDNSIWLVARKNTGVRVYTDWDSAAGLPPINRLTGSLTVQTSSTTLTLNPINSGNSISPLRDAQINMAVADQTLNFMIPAAWCVGTVTVTGELWDQSAPGSRSARYTRTIVFTPAEPLNLYLVGINYQAVSPNIPAPTQSAISTTIVSLIKSYPVGDVIQTGYTTLNFNESVTGNVANGCGSGFNDLLDRLNDLRGSSGDIYLGTLPAGILSTPGNSVGGCAPQGGKTAATFVDYTVNAVGDVPHEIGHALDRHHAPCSTGCAVSPADPDPNYPQYGSFRSDSIGVFGFDPTSNAVFSPSQFSDFMAYFFPQWVSAYTYNGLRGSYFHATGGPSPGAAAHFREEVDFDIIFLGLTISRDRTVKRRPSFNFQGKLLNRKRCGQFTVELQNETREPLSCSPLHCNCDEGCGCWPKNIRDVVPFPKGTRWLVVYEGDTKIYEEEVPPDPEIKIESGEQTKEGIILTWKPKREDGKLWYLVHWYDRRAEAWRGVAPRQQTQRLLIPKRLFSGEKELRVRVLATPGLGTGVAEQVIKLKKDTPQRPRIILSGIDTSMKKPVQIPGVLHAALVDSAGRQLTDDRMTWYGDDKFLGRGTQVDLRSLSIGKHYIRLATRSDLRSTAITWQVERTLKDFVLHAEVCDPKPKRPQPPHVHPHPAPQDPCSDGEE
jgi:hypothetical protein